MKFIKKQKILYIAIILLIILLLLNNIKIFSISSDLADSVYNIICCEYNPENVDICILDYCYVTGASWRVEKSTNKDIENKFVVLDTICNPRMLKINKDFSLDYMAKYVVVIDKNITKTNVDNEYVDVLKANKIIITNYNYKNDNMRFCDLTFGGKLMSAIALFVPKFKLQM